MSWIENQANLDYWLIVFRFCPIDGEGCVLPGAGELPAPSAVTASFEVDGDLTLIFGVVTGVCDGFLCVCPTPFGMLLAFPLTCGAETWDCFRGLAVYTTWLISGVKHVDTLVHTSKRLSFEEFSEGVEFFIINLSS